MRRVEGGMMFVYMVIIMFVGDPIGMLLPKAFLTPERCVEIAKNVKEVASKEMPAYGLCVAVKKPNADKVAMK